MWIVALIVCIVLVGLDQIAKYMALTQLKPIGNVTIFPGFLDFTFVENRGAAFGILEGQRWFFILITIVISVIVIIAFFKLPRSKAYTYFRIGLILVLSGAIGNFIDRLLNGYVVDFLEFTFISYPVFNLADIYVVVGAILLAFLLIFVIKEEPNPKKREDNGRGQTNE